ncbi:uncharacterized protein G2W53_002697 [Senna tora]|uniref:Uncharacterized protein n=1 Tax=Senna tora TaxID=362788 RepID=A0A834X8V2_9FABA|nr:uncharacterized protein G2W53_002697 [Senna tora]
MVLAESHITPSIYYYTVETSRAK